MTSRSAWKGRERQSARFFGAERTPLSGGNSRHTRSDSLHKRLFIEQKLRAKHATCTLFQETKALAKKEKKIPVITLAEKRKPGFLICVHSSNFEEVARLYLEMIDGQEHAASES